jgi:hypothetical protein
MFIPSTKVSVVGKFVTIASINIFLSYSRESSRDFGP